MSAAFLGAAAAWAAVEGRSDAIVITSLSVYPQNSVSLLRVRVCGCLAGGGWLTGWLPESLPNGSAFGRCRFGLSGARIVALVAVGVPNDPKRASARVIANEVYCPERRTDVLKTSSSPKTRLTPLLDLNCTFHFRLQFQLILCTSLLT